MRSPCQTATPALAAKYEAFFHTSGTISAMSSSCFKCSHTTYVYRLESSQELVCGFIHDIAGIAFEAETRNNTPRSG